MTPKQIGKIVVVVLFIGFIKPQLGTHKVISKGLLRRSQKFFLSESTVFTLLTFLFLLFFTPSLMVKYHLFYQSLFFVCIISVVFKKKVLNVLLSKYGLPIILCLLTFFIFWLADHGDRSLSTLKSFFRGLIIFIMSFSMARQPKSLQILSILLFSALLFLAQKMMGEVFFSTDILANRVAIVNAVAANLDLLEQEYLTVSSYMVVFVAYICFSATLAFSFLDFSSRLWAKTIVFVAFVLSLMFCLKSLWTAPIIILTLSLLSLRAIHIFTLPVKRVDRKVLEILKSVVIFIIFIVISTHILESFQFGEAQDRAQRLRTIFSMVFMDSSMPVDVSDLSSGRTELFSMSINGFLSAPILGVGDLTHSEYVSNHGSIQDLLARFGLVGFIPFVYMYMFYVNLSYRLVRMRIRSEHWTHIALLTFLIVFFISNFGNPYFLTSTPEILFFLASGFVAGRYEFLTNKYRLFK